MGSCANPTTPALSWKLPERCCAGCEAGGAAFAREVWQNLRHSSPNGRVDALRNNAFKPHAAGRSENRGAVGLDMLVDPFARPTK